MSHFADDEMSKVSSMLDILSPAHDEHGSPVLQSEYERLKQQLAERDKSHEELCEIVASLANRVAYLESCAEEEADVDVLACEMEEVMEKMEEVQKDIRKHYDYFDAILLGEFGT